MGNDKHTSKSKIPLELFGKKHFFHVVPNNFPLLEDGIIGVPFLENYKYRISNDTLTLDGRTIRHETEILIPPNEMYTTKIPINERPHLVHLHNPTNEPVTYPINHLNPTLSERIEILKKKVDLHHVDPELKPSLEKIIVSYSDIFVFEDEDLPCTNLTKHVIEPKTQRPINMKSYRPPEVHKDEIDRQIKQMLDQGIIEESDSPYNSPIWIVPKKLDNSGKRKWRLVIDFRRLNQETDQDAYPLPPIDEILDHLGKSKFFSALDLSSGFHQIAMDENSKKYTAFSTPQGHFQYRRMPFGLKNAPATFQRMIDNALRGLIGKICFAYLDDIVVFGTTIEEHNRNLATVFQRLRELGLKLQPDKSKFLRPELEYLGHVITADGVKPNPEKIQSVAEFPTPKSVTNVKSFLGIAGYYRKFIKNFAKLAKPLTELTEKNTPFHWTDAQQKSFDILKRKLCESPILRYPDFNKPFTLTTDASDTGLGAILSQEGHPCCYISRTLNKAEINYTTTEKELLAIVWAVKRLRQYLLGKKFKILTDHQALKWLFSVKDPSSRLLRWRLRMEEYDYEIDYTKGKENTAADGLSRVYPLLSQPQQEDNENTPSNTNADIDELEQTQLFTEYENWKQNPDPTYILPTRPNPIGKVWKPLHKEMLGSYDPLKWLVKLDKILQTSLEQRHTVLKVYLTEPFRLVELLELRQILSYLGYRYSDQLELIFSENQMELSREEQLRLIEECHNSNAAQHFGETKTLKRVQEKAIWRNMENDIVEFVKGCESCQREKLIRIRSKEPAIIPDTPHEPNDKIAMDILGPLTPTNRDNKYILSIQDVLTKYLVLIPLKTIDTATIIDELLRHYIYIFSAPKHILTDQGSNFISKLMQEFETQFQIRHIKTTAFHPESNGSLERTHSTILNLIRTCMRDKNNEWDENLQLVCMGFNTAVHESTGYTPFELTFGHKANLPSTIASTPLLSQEELFKHWKQKHNAYIHKARYNLEKTKEKTQRRTNQNIIRTQPVFNVGDYVFLHNDNVRKNKLEPEWLGPYLILGTSSPTYTIKLDDTRTAKIHGNRLKPCIFRFPDETRNNSDSRVTDNPRTSIQ
ncbi:Retrovirus-related Pol polyprotein from transposon 412 [Anthophora quadrimaculata]